uniref:P66_CC domain-containing protein n=1 Tax=Strongyloides papillosus TaxID=174720 RepID=A0A0N5CGS6_STREA
MQVHSVVMENSSENHLPQTMNFSGIDNEKLKGKDDSVLSVDNSQDNVDDTHDPSLRRSTRVSALKAQEKIKLKDSVVQDVGMVESIVPTTENCQPVKKKPKIVHPELLDQYHCSFGVKLVENEVCLMSDGSEISSLNGDEVDEMKQVMEDKQAQQSTESEKREQMIEIKHLKAALRKEEAKLLMLNKMKSSQQSNIKQDHKKNTAQYVSNGFKSATSSSHSNRNTNNRFANQNGANLEHLKTPDSAALNQLSQFFQRIFSSNILAPGIQNQAKEFLALLAQSHKNSPQAAAALQQAALQMFNKIKATMPMAGNNTNTPPSKTPQQQTVNNPPPPTTTVPKTTSQPQSSVLQQQQQLQQQQNNEERRKQIRCQLRKHVEDNLRTVIKWPEILRNNFNFVPNALAPDFTGLHGLNNVVQKNLKDKSVSMKIEVDLYECSICGTDWTPTWRAIGDSENEEDLKIACDKCAKESKLKIITEKYTEYLFKFLDQIAKQESELEAQIEAGKFDIQVQQPPTQQQQSSQSSASSKQAPTTATNVPTNKSKSNSTMVNGVTSNVSQQKQSVPSTSNIPKQQSQKAGSKRSAPIPATASSSSSSSSSTNPFNNPTAAQYAQLISAALASKNQVSNPQQNLALLALNQQIANNPAMRVMLQNLTANPVTVSAFVQAMANPNNQQNQQAMFLKTLLEAQAQSQKQQAELVKKMTEQALQQQQQQNLRNQQAAKASQAAAAKVAASLNAGNEGNQNAAALQNNEMLKRILTMAQLDPSLALLIKSNPGMIQQYLAQQSLQNAGKK